MPESSPQRQELWSRPGIRLAVTICTIAALVTVALLVDPGSDAWYIKFWELVEAVLTNFHHRPAGQQ
jgi:hypothetical protein